ncbi:acyloxyacyl hydrolase [Erythrobacter sp. HA6-11]
MHNRVLGIVVGMFALVGMASPAQADEIFTGAYVHGVDTPFSLEVADQDGASFQLGYRFDPVEQVLDIEPYVIASVNTEGDSSFFGIGISRKFDLGGVYVRPGVGLVVQDQSGVQFDPVTFRRKDLGSQVLFEPEIAIGARLSEQVSIEASWVHLSHAQLLDSEQNPGVDMFGVRLNLAL